MTSASYSSPQLVTDIDSAAEILRAAGHRVSAPRRLLLEGLLRADGPVSAELLAAGIGGGGTPSDLPSVYRNLELLEKLGLVRHVHIGHGPGLYALAGEASRCYVVCEHCNRLSRLPLAEVEAIQARIEELTGYEAHFSHFPVLGLCPTCARQRDGRAATDDGDEAIEGGAMTHHGNPDEHDHVDDDAHSHEHSHDGETHSHPHDAHDHDHTEHEHEHSHGDRVHAHPHVHQEGLEDEHQHPHEG